MSAIFVKEIAGVTQDPDQIRFTQQGKPVLNVNLAFSDTRKDEQTQQWENLNEFYVKATAWDRAAEQLAEVAAKGVQLLVWGKLRTEKWQDKDGNNRTSAGMTIQGFRPVGKLPQVGGDHAQQAGGFGGAQSSGWGSQQPAADPWGGTQPSGGSWDAPAQSEPPF